MAGKREEGRQREHCGGTGGVGGNGTERAEGRGLRWTHPGLHLE